VVVTDRRITFFLCDLLIVDKEKATTANKASKSQSNFFAAVLRKGVRRL
jgi:hypothetical protein